MSWCPDFAFRGAQADGVGCFLMVVAFFIVFNVIMIVVQPMISLFFAADDKAPKAAVKAVAKKKGR